MFPSNTLCIWSKQFPVVRRKIIFLAVSLRIRNPLECPNHSIEVTTYFNNKPAFITARVFILKTISKFNNFTHSSFKSCEVAQLQENAACSLCRINLFYPFENVSISIDDQWIINSRHYSTRAVEIQDIFERKKSSFSIDAIFLKMYFRFISF